MEVQKKRRKYTFAKLHNKRGLIRNACLFEFESALVTHTMPYEYT